MAELISKIPKSTVIKMSDSFEFAVSNKLKAEKKENGKKRDHKKMCEFNKKIMHTPFWEEGLQS